MSYSVMLVFGITSLNSLYEAMRHGEPVTFFGEFGDCFKKARFDHDLIIVERLLLVSANWLLMFSC